MPLSGGEESACAVTLAAAADGRLPLALVVVVAVGGPAGPPARAAPTRISGAASTACSRPPTMANGDWARPSRRRTRACRRCAAYVRWRELLESKDQPPFAAYADFLRREPDWPSLGTLQARAEDALDEYGRRSRIGSPSSPTAQPRTRQGRDPLRRGAARRGPARRGRGAAAARAGSRTISRADEEAAFLDRYGADLRRRRPCGAARPAAVGRADRSGAAHAAAGRPRRSGRRRRRG